MRLLYITNGINGSGGLERVLSIKASRLADDFGYEVHLLVLNEAHQNPFYEFSPNIQFHSVSVGGNPLSYFFSYKNGIQNTVTQIHPDVILVCDDGLKGFFLPMLIRTEAKWVYERHVSKLIELKSDRVLGFHKWKVGIKWWLMKKLGKRFDRFVVLTRGNQKEWRSLTNMMVLPNPLSFFPSDCSRLDSKIVLCVGKISYQKGQDMLAKAWHKVHKRYPDWMLHLYGKEDLTFLDTKNLPSSIQHFPPEKNIEETYLGSSIYVMPSRFEGFGMVLIEAMACGVPCISFDCPYGPQDIITDGVDGYLVEKENIEALAQRIMKLISDNSVRKQLGAAAKQSVRRFEEENVLKQWDVLFKDLQKKA